MIVVMKQNCCEGDINAIADRAKALDLEPEIFDGATRKVVLLRVAEGTSEANEFLSMPCVERIIPLDRGDGLFRGDDGARPAVVDVGGARIGAGDAVVIAGPCAVESPDQAFAVARAVRDAGAKIFRAGAFKPRTSPYSFQGLGERGLKILDDVRAETGLKVVTEAMDAGGLELVAEHADMIQIGSRNMQNYPLLRRAGRMGVPILLKRGMAATLEEWLMAAEYILNEGQDQVVLCERGVRTFSDHSRFTLDLGAVPAIRELSHLPVLVDPSHGTGSRTRVPAMARAALAAGADGLMIEVHDRPEDALSDGPQSLDTAGFAGLMNGLRRLASAIDVRI